MTIDGRFSVIVVVLEIQCVFLYFLVGDGERLVKGVNPLLIDAVIAYCGLFSILTSVGCDP